jgi:predicted acylesterase/phospholipase RssA/CRP-like cAMP-binding protein
MNKFIKILESHPLFQGLSGTHLNELAGKSTLLWNKSGDVIYKIGEKAENIYIVLNGVYEAKDPRHTTPWQQSEYLSAGDLFGDGGILEESTRCRSVTCNSAGQLLQIPGNALKDLIQESERLTAILESSRKTIDLHFDRKSLTFEQKNQHITSFVDIARHPSTQKVIRHICRTLNFETNQPVLLIQLLEKGGEISMHELKERTSAIIAKNQLPEAINEELSFIQLKLRLSEDDTGLPELLTLISLSRNYFPNIVIYVAARTYCKTVQECIRLSTMSYIGVTSQNVKQYYSNHFLQHLDPSLKSKIKVLLIVNKNDPKPARSEIEAQIGFPIHNIILTNPKSIPILNSMNGELERKKRFTAQFRRIVREILGKRIGLVLSSGGAKGFAHIGVIQVLEENNIEIDYIAGSSMGSYIGACWAAGYSGKELERLACEYEKPFSVFKLMSPSLAVRQGLVSCDKLESRLDQILNHARFRDLTIPLTITATNLKSLKNTFIRRGVVSSAVRASCSIPGICVPYERSDGTYIDGGVMDPLPIDALEEMGIERIIAVSTVLTSEHNRICQLRFKDNKPKKGIIHGISDFINKRINYFASGNVFNTIMRSIEASQIRLVERDLLRSDVAIQPITCENDWLQFNDPQKHIELGRECAEKHLHEIKKLAA